MASRNIISAKLSFLVILLMLVGMGVLQFTYGLTQASRRKEAGGRWQMEGGI